MLPAAQLIDAVVELPNVPPGIRLEITIPTGDAEMPEQIRNRCHDVTPGRRRELSTATTFPRD